MSRGVLSFLEVNGVELSNQARVQAYLERIGHPLANQRRWYSILDTELGVPAVAPAVDPAPWYSPLAPESADFLGFLIVDLDVTEKSVRPAAARAIGGFAIGAEQDEGEVMRVQGLLCASSPAGLEYGRGWLRSMLGEDPCNPCSLSTLRYRAANPPPTDATVGEWLLYDAGLTGEGIVPGDYDSFGSSWELVSFTLSSQHPWRFRAPVDVSTGVLVAEVGGQVDLIDFTTNPFTDLRLACSPLGCTTTSVCPPTVTAGHAVTPVWPARSAFYRAGQFMQDGSLVVKLTLSSVALADTFSLAARWANADRNDASSRGIFATLDRSGASQRIQLRDLAFLTGTPCVPTALRAGGMNASLLFSPLSAGSTVWLRLDVRGTTVTFEVWTVDPYNGGSALRTDATAVETLSGTTVNEETASWGVWEWYQTGASSGSLDDLNLHGQDCMRFDEWLCGTPPVAADAIPLAPTRPGGQVAALVTLDATNGQIANAFIEAYHGACPIPDGSTPFATINVPLVAVGGRLIIDSARERITFEDGAGGVFDGSALLELGDGRDVEWISAPACDAPICVRAGVSRWCGTSTDAAITVARQERAR